ncbi:hypothetical protein MAUB1S_09555 [Mycolicibacterium aubagnense]
MRMTIPAWPVFWLGFVPLAGAFPSLRGQWLLPSGPPYSVGHATDFHRVSDSPALRQAPDSAANLAEFASKESPDVDVG